MKSLDFFFLQIMQPQQTEEDQDNGSEHDFGNKDDNASMVSTNFPTSPTHMTRRYSPESFTNSSSFSIRTSDPYFKRPSTTATRAGTRPRTCTANSRLSSSLTYSSKTPATSKTQPIISNKQQLFQPQAPPRQINGPVFFYRKLNKIEQKERATHLQEIKRKSFNQNINSPFKQDMLQLRENSVRSSRKNLAEEHQKWTKQRYRENKQSQKAIIEDYEKERRHCKKDVLSRTHPIVHILDLDS